MSMWVLIRTASVRCSNKYLQSMFLSRNKKNNVYPCKLQFYYIKVGFKGVNIIYACFRDDFVNVISIHYLIWPLAVTKYRAEFTFIIITVKWTSMT